ncbi:MAG TPA: DUF2332 domain-containing protein [Ktedonobacteraceae bacterium]|nr:DUF2332 domain-containing protein [Ktedonobacteraceae bacterium]
MDVQRPYQDELLEKLARSVEWHGVHAYGNPDRENGSPLYTQLCPAIAADPAVLALITEADRNQQVSNLLFAAVHFLLLSGIQHPLADFYPSLSASPRPNEEAYPFFRAFCLEHADDIRRLVSTQRVQTNEVGRCSAFLPAFELVSRLGQRKQFLTDDLSAPAMNRGATTRKRVGRLNSKPLAMIEIGPSAGLNMLWDKFGYDYGSAGYAGDKASPVQLHCQTRGQLLPPLPATMPQVVKRVGIDLLPIDVNDEQATRWLRALIWPEQQGRARLLTQALELARRYPPTLLKGNALNLLPAVLAEMPTDATLCIYHSYALNQTPRAIREQILELIAHYGKTHDLFRVSQEWFAGQEQAQVELYHYQQGEIQQTLLTYCESHGRWLEWLYQEDSGL